MNRKTKLLPIAAVVSGGVLMALRTWLYAAALDEKNLLLAGHPISYGIWLVAALCLGLSLTAALGTGKTGAVPAYTSLAGAGDLLLALVMGAFVCTMGESTTLVQKLCFALGVLSIPALGYTAVCRWKGKPVFFGCFAVVCVFFALYLVANYQTWSSNPQLQDYVFAMLACVSVTLFAYQNAAFCVDGGSETLWRFAGMLAVCFGIAAVAQSQQGLLYGGIALWTLTGLLPQKQ